MKKLLFSIFVIVLAGAVWYYSQPSNTIIDYTIEPRDTGTGITDDVDMTVDDQLGDIIGYVSEIEGEVTRSGTGIAAGDGVYGHDTLLTASGSAASIILVDDSIVRLDADSQITFSITSDARHIELFSGSIWTRILAPLTDNEMFTVSTTDISAGIRGTSVRFSKTDSGTMVEVFDSSDEGEDAGVVLFQEDIDPVQVRPEEAAITRRGEVRKRKISPTEVYKNSEFVRESTKKDLVFMKKLQETKKKRGKNTDKVAREFKKTLPTQKEMQTLFEETSLATLTGTGNLETDEVLQEELLKNMKKDIEVSTLKRRIQRTKNKSQKQRIRQEMQQVIEQEDEIENDVVDVIMEQILDEGRPPELKERIQERVQKRKSRTQTTRPTQHVEPPSNDTPGDIPKNEEVSPKPAGSGDTTHADVKPPQASHISKPQQTPVPVVPTPKPTHVPPESGSATGEVHVIPGGDPIPLPPELDEEHETPHHDVPPLDPEKEVRDVLREVTDFDIDEPGELPPPPDPEDEPLPPLPEDEGELRDENPDEDMHKDPEIPPLLPLEPEHPTEGDMPPPHLLSEPEEEMDDDGDVGETEFLKGEDEEMEDEDRSELLPPPPLETREDPDEDEPEFDEDPDEDEPEGEDREDVLPPPPGPSTDPAGPPAPPPHR